MRSLLTLLLLCLCWTAQAQNTIPTGCITAPFPTTPTGPTWTGTSGVISNEQFRFTVWRKPCSPTSAVLLVTVEPTIGSPFICSSNVDALQSSAQYTSFRLQSTTASSSFCTNLLITTTFVLLEISNGTLFNPNAASTLIIDSNTSSVPNLRIEVGGYNAADYGNTSNIPITGKQSGSWYNPSRGGDGFLLEIGSTGSARTIIASWYSYDAGRQQWIFGSAPLPSGATSVTVPMITTTGANFGSAFRPNDVVNTTWGTVTFSFTGCNAMTVAYAKQGGENGTIQMQRLLSQIDGLACP